MRTSLNEIQAIEDYLLHKMTPENALLFEVNMLLNKDLVNDMQHQQNAYAAIRRYGRQKIKEEIVAVQNKLATAPQHHGFMQHITRLFRKH